MAQNRDKRRRTDLDLFVLALIDSEISTPYDLQKTASLSPGATIPVLQRLIEAGYIGQGKPGLRGRTDHRITPAGRKFLKSGWRDLIDDGPSGDLDADLRVALLALWVGNDRDQAADFLRKAAARRLETIGAIDEPDNAPSVPALARWYRMLRAASAQALLKGESTAALAMAKALPRNSSGRQHRNKRKPKP